MGPYDVCLRWAFKARGTIFTRAQQSQSVGPIKVGPSGLIFYHLQQLFVQFCAQLVYMMSCAQSCINSCVTRTTPKKKLTIASHFYVSHVFQFFTERFFSMYLEPHLPCPFQRAITKDYYMKMIKY